MHRTRPNPCYLLLLAASVAFVVTALAYGVVPFDHQPAWLQEQGWRILLVEVAAVILFGLASMALDRIQSLRSGTNQESGVRNQAPENKP